MGQKGEVQIDQLIIISPVHSIRNGPALFIGKKAISQQIIAPPKIT